jgi:hypothetical protein
MDTRALLLVFILVTGCVSPAIAPPRDEMARVKAVRIVPMEAPPLGVPLEFRNLLPNIASPVLVYNTIAVLVETPAAQGRSAEFSSSFQASLEAKGSWMPTRVLADEVRAQLNALGIAASVESEVRPIPAVKERGYTLLMENWMAPIRAWYNDTKPVTDYAGLTLEQGQYVLEVAVSNYEIYDGKLLMSVMMKMIDPSSGRVRGRARALRDPAKLPQVAPFDKSFSNDAVRFKAIVAAEGQTLVKACLTQLGLVK